MSLSFYDIDKDYVRYLQEGEKKERGFTRVPNVEYPGKLPKFTCGVVLDIHGKKYYVPVSSYKKKQKDNILIIIEGERKNPIKGSLRFNYMIPVPDMCITERIISKDPNKILLNLEWLFCNDNESKIRNKAKRTYSKVVNKVNEDIVLNSCDFLLLEKLCDSYVDGMNNANIHITKKQNYVLELHSQLHFPKCFRTDTYSEKLKRIKLKNRMR